MEPIFIAFEAELNETDVESRIISGSIVPYGVAGDESLVDGEPQRVLFEAGSIAPFRRRTPLVLGHDMNRPVGVLDGELVHAEDGVTARFRIDETPDGDVALAQAASGSRACFSVGTRVTRRRKNGAVLEVQAAELFHVGLVPLGAFSSAEVEQVAASLSFPTERTDMAPEPVTAPEAPAATAATPEVVEASAVEVPVILTAQAAPVELAPGDGARLVLAMLRAQNGDREAASYVEAALSVIDSTDVPGLVPVTHTTEILGGVTVDRVLAERVAVRRPMPADGMKITKPRWTTLPNGGWVAENAATPSNAPEVGTEDVTILQWAYGVAMSYAVANRSSPDAIESIFRAAVEDYYNDVEQKLADAIMAVDQPGAAGAGLGAGVAAFYGDRKQGPNILLCAPDIFGDLLDAEGFLMYASGAVTAGDTGLRGSIGGLEVVVSPHLPAGTEIVTRRGAIELRETDPVQLTAAVIGALQVELGVTSFTSIDVEQDDAFHSLTPAAGAPSEGKSEAKRSTTKAKK